MEKVFTAVKKGLEKRGYHVTLALGGPSWIDRTWENISNATVGPLDNWNRRYRFVDDLFRQIKLIIWLYKILRKENNAVIIASPMEGLYAHLSLMLHGCRRRVSLLSWLHFAPSNEYTNRKSMLSRISWLVFAPSKSYRRLQLWRYPYLDLCDAHLAISTGIAGEIIEANPKSTVYTIYNPLPESENSVICRPEHGRDKEFIFVGRLENKHKRIDRILCSLSEIANKNWRLTILGDGPDKLSLMALSHELGLDGKVNFTGWLDNPWDFVQSASALLFTSETEGFGIVLAEAISRGVAVIAMNCKYGPEDIIVNGENGFLVKEGDVKAFTEILQKIVADEIPLPGVEQVQATAGRFGIARVLDSFEEAIMLEYRKRGM
jgi:glycosyltransferase involved in cell wall biosynthesis